MKNTIVYCLVLIISILSLVSCDGLLDKYPLDSLSNETFWNTEDDALLALTGVYQQNNMEGQGKKRNLICGIKILI